MKPRDWDPDAGSPDMRWSVCLCTALRGQTHSRAWLVPELSFPCNGLKPHTALPGEFGQAASIAIVFPQADQTKERAGIDDRHPGVGVLFGEAP